MSAAAHDRHLDPPDPPDWSRINEVVTDLIADDVLEAIWACCETYRVKVDDCDALESIRYALSVLELEDK